MLSEPRERKNHNRKNGQGSALFFPFCSLPQPEVEGGHPSVMPKSYINLKEKS